MNCPQIERCHRLGRRHDDRSRPVIMKLIYIRAKIQVLENGFKLKGSDMRIAEDFTPHIHLVCKKMWDTSAPSWNMALASNSVMTTYSSITYNTIGKMQLTPWLNVLITQLLRSPPLLLVLVDFDIVHITFVF